MKIYYLVTITYNKELEDGYIKQTSDQFITDAVSYTDAEQIAYAYAEQNIHGEFTLSKVVKTNLSEILNNDDSDSFFKAKVVYSTVDGDKDKEVVINSYLLVNADSAKQAIERIEEHLKSMLVPYTIPSVALTKVLEIINGMDYAKS